MPSPRRTHNNNRNAAYDKRRLQGTLLVKREGVYVEDVTRAVIYSQGGWLVRYKKLWQPCRRIGQFTFVLDLD